MLKLKTHINVDQHWQLGRQLHDELNTHQWADITFRDDNENRDCYLYAQRYTDHGDILLKKRKKLK
jgi:hypothetical protein